MLGRYRSPLIFLSITVMAVVLELSLHELNARDEIIYLFFVLSILIIIIETKELRYGVLASLVFVFSFDYFITEPIYTLRIYNPNHYISFIIFIIVSFVVNSLVLQLQKQIQISHRNQERLSTMYELLQTLNSVKSTGGIFESVTSVLEERLNRKVAIATAEGRVYGHQEICSSLQEVIDFSREKNIVLRRGNGLLEGRDLSIYPIVSETESYGVLLVEDVGAEDLGDDEAYNDEAYIENALREIEIVLDNHRISNQRQETRIQFENEKFKTSLLRSLSHDIRTPLTMIQSGSDFLNTSFSDIGEEEKKSIIRDIYQESCDLTVFVESLLELSRLQEGKQLVNRQEEMVDDLFSEINRRVRHRLQGHTFTIRRNEEVLTVYCDSRLLIQVFINLIDNAIKHSRRDSEIELAYYREGDAGGAAGAGDAADAGQDGGSVVFEVADNGGGISEELQDRIFEDFYSLTSKLDSRRSTGLGLSICKAIVEAHGGEICAFNNDAGGATFRFSIPGKEMAGHEQSDSDHRG